MAAVTVRNLREETHRALKVRARARGVSTEAEIRSILDEAVVPQERVKLGTALRELADKYGSIDFEITRDPTPTKEISFE